MAEVQTTTGARGWTDEFKSFKLFAVLRLVETNLLNLQTDAIKLMRGFRHWQLPSELTTDV